MEMLLRYLQNVSIFVIMHKVSTLLYFLYLFVNSNKNLWEKQKQTADICYKGTSYWQLSMDERDYGILVEVSFDSEFEDPEQSYKVQKVTDGHDFLCEITYPPTASWHLSI